MWQSSLLNTNMSAWEFNVGVRTFYSNVWGAPISVLKYMYDENGNPTSNVLRSVKTVFTILVTRSIP
jgi:hypothetical protein